MTSKYFSIERNDNCYMPVHLVDENGNIAFEDLMEMSYEDMKSYDRLEEFVVYSMDAANSIDLSNDVETTITLIGEDGAFIWGLIIGPGEDIDSVNYVFIDWKKDGMRYRYAEDV